MSMRRWLTALVFLLPGSLLVAATAVLAVSLLLFHPVSAGGERRHPDRFSGLARRLDRLTRDPRVSLEVIYLDCDVSELIRRISRRSYTASA